MQNSHIILLVVHQMLLIIIDFVLSKALDDDTACTIYSHVIKEQNSQKKCRQNCTGSASNESTQCARRAERAQPQRIALYARLPDPSSTNIWRSCEQERISS